MLVSWSDPFYTEEERYRMWFREVKDQPDFFEALLDSKWISKIRFGHPPLNSVGLTREESVEAAKRCYHKDRLDWEAKLPQFLGEGDRSDPVGKAFKASPFRKYYNRVIQRLEESGNTYEVDCSLGFPLMGRLFLATKYQEYEIDPFESHIISENPSRVYRSRFGSRV